MMDGFFNTGVNDPMKESNSAGQAQKHKPKSPTRLSDRGVSQSAQTKQITINVCNEKLKPMPE